MFHIKDLVGQVITIRSIAGNEFVGKLISWNPDRSILTVQKPRTVALDQDQVVLVPFAVTANSDTVFFPGADLIVMPTDDAVAKNYLEALE